MEYICSRLSDAWLDTGRVSEQSVERVAARNANDRPRRSFLREVQRGRLPGVIVNLAAAAFPVLCAMPYSDTVHRSGVARF